MVYGCEPIVSFVLSFLMFSAGFGSLRISFLGLLGLFVPC